MDCNKLCINFFNNLSSTGPTTWSSGVKEFLLFPWKGLSSRHFKAGELAVQLLNKPHFVSNQSQTGHARNFYVVSSVDEFPECDSSDQSYWTVIYNKKICFSILRIEEKFFLTFR